MKYQFIGWCKEDDHDKVWGVIELAHDIDGAGQFSWNPKNSYVTFWGRRGKKLQTKISNEYESDIKTIIRRKEKKGYQSINATGLDEVYPEFQSDLEKTAVWSMLKAQYA
jgi:predicted DNA-binding WGR domain protein